MSTTVCTQTRTLAAKHGNAVLRKTVSSPAAAAAVQELVGGALQCAAQDHRAARIHSPGTGNERTEVGANGEGAVAARCKLAPALSIDPHRSTSGESDDSATSSALSQRATPMAYMEAGDVASGGVPDSVREEPKDYALADSAGAHTLRMLQRQPRTPVPDGPVYTALQREVAYLKLNGQDAEATAGGLSRYSMARGPPPCARADVGDEQSDTAGAASPQDKKMLTMEASLEDAKTSNRLLSRALSAVQQRLKQTEAEREQLRRERDYFRNLALRFPFTLSAGGLDVPAAARR